MCDAPESTIVIFSLISLLGGIFIGWILFSKPKHRLMDIEL